jgi:hypothetical protein
VKRRAFNVAAGVSLLLCVATAALWATSYTMLGDTIGGTAVRLVSVWGRLDFFIGPTKAFSLPHWVMFLLTGVLPAVWFDWLGKMRKPADGHCSNCGYDLRATPDRCPECGAVPAAKPT